ncbi:3-deoxy-D-manno-octulosonic acid kinase [Kushneria sinocarnis]|uniref:3-deoxy-D-manno-octulosonic acid kinase n=2 Tax=Kushneria sinocarnis TaxID=595502 RepID=A0A420X0Y4_9GAMM|nr:3-deoxy-D-manno-octulosonic acid kinase [Kushneria sinocarnis]
MATSRKANAHILYDPESAPQMNADWFRGDYWRQRRAVTGEAPGRGASLFIVHGDRHWVLRHYHRGGLAARLSRQRYLWQGAERSRPFREFRLTATLHDARLPVPRPIGACIWRFGALHEGALITERLLGTRALASVIAEPGVDPRLLAATGCAIRRCHAAGLDHVDLNARNLLVSESPTARAWVIDLDRCRLRSPGRWQQRNLDRLQRSLQRFAPERAESLMAGILGGYHAEFSTAPQQV